MVIFRKKKDGSVLVGFWQDKCGGSLYESDFLLNPYAIAFICLVCFNKIDLIDLGAPSDIGQFDTR